ncbi:hypothetical protein NEIRO02_2598, partial [Nematocida sp. AWRm79]
GQAMQDPLPPPQTSFKVTSSTELATPQCYHWAALNKGPRSKYDLDVLNPIVTRATISTQISIRLYRPSPIDIIMSTLPTQFQLISILVDNLTITCLYLI